MRVRYQPEITCSDGGELHVLIPRHETFTPASLIAEREVLREAYGAMVDIRASRYNVEFRLRPFDKDVQAADLDRHEFNYAVNGVAETPEVLFACSKGGALDPEQPLSAFTVSEYLAALSKDSYEWGIIYGDPYLWVNPGQMLLPGRHGGFVERRLNPKYKRAHVGISVAVRHCYADTMTMWVEAVDEPEFNREAAEALVFVTNLAQKDRQVTARLSGKPWLGQFSSFLSDFLNKDSAWKFTLQFAHALGYHPVDNRFTITFDDRHSMTYVPPAVSDRS